jgi:acetolactate synthase-1/2/3 large subunit
MKASDYIADFLHAQGVPFVFEVVGGMIAHLIDSLHGQGRIRLVSVHHEQAAAFAADGVGRMTGVPGVAMATSGPGATNLLTGIGSCFFDSTPAVFITGQVNVHEQKGSRAIRQLGFQETDIVAVAAPLTKAAWRITRADEIPERLSDAFRTAISGRPGPVLLDVPFDLQRAAITAPPPVRVQPAPMAPCDADALRPLLRDLAAARRVLLDVPFDLQRAARSRSSGRKASAPREPSRRFGGSSIGWTCRSSARSSPWTRCRTPMTAASA